MPADAERVPEIQEAFAALARSLKRISIYRHAREQHAAFLEPALAALRSLLDRDGSVTVAVEPTALTFASQPVYSEPAREWSLCFRMHRDGVRSLTFKRGLGLSELMTFVGVALPDPQGGVGPGREDAVTELWKADLENLAYSAVSGYRMDQNEESRDLVQNAVAEVSQRTQATLDRFGQDFSFSQEEAARDRPPLASDALRAALDPELWSDLARRAELTLLRIVEKNFAGRDLESLEEAFGRLLDELVDRKEAGALGAALERLAELPGQNAPEFRAALGRRLMESWRVARIVELSAASPEAFTIALPAYVGLLPPEAGPSLLDGVEMESTVAVREAVARAAADRLKGCRDRYEERIRRGTPEVARALLGALDHTTPTSLRAAVALNGLNHRDLRVALDAITLVGADPPTALKHLGGLLVHADPSIRTASATVLGGCAPAAEEASKLLLTAMGKPDFEKAERAERTVFCRALGRLATNAGFSFLSEQLTHPHKSLFNKKKAEEDQLLAVQGLGAEASPRCLKLLEHAGQPAQGFPAAVAAAARAAANHVRNALNRGGA